MLGWIPLVGPIIQGLLNTGSSIYSKFKDTELGKLQTNRSSDIQETQLSNELIKETQSDDLALRMMRDAYCLPAVVQVLLTGWDTMVAENSWHIYMWHVAKFPPSLEWYPFSVAVFLIGNIGLNMWKRK